MLPEMSREMKQLLYKMPGPTKKHGEGAGKWA